MAFPSQVVGGGRIDWSARSLAGPAPAKDHGLVPQLLSSPGFYPSLMAPVKAIDSNPTFFGSGAIWWLYGRGNEKPMGLHSQGLDPYEHFEGGVGKLTSLIRQVSYGPDPTRTPPCYLIRLWDPWHHGSLLLDYPCCADNCAVPAHPRGVDGVLENPTRRRPKLPTPVGRQHKL